MSIFKPHLSQMTAYQPPLEGRNPNTHLLLDFNERTLPVSYSIKQALIDYIQGDQLQVYPSYGDIVTKIARYCKVEPSQVMITNGSDQGIDLITRAACTDGDEAIIPGPSFAMYTQCARIENLDIIEPQYSRENGFPVQEVMNSITDKTRLIVIANPNNPSGTEVKLNDILTIARAAPDTVILVDECYFEYTRQTLAKKVSEVPNLLITRTFSKTWGLPSIRLGYIISHKDNINTLLNVRGPYDVNQFAAIAINAALDDPFYTQRYVREVMDSSKPLLEAYLKKKSIDYWPAVANFLWIFPPSPKAVETHLRDRGILVRPKKDNTGKLGLRITIGDKPQTERLIQALEKAF